MAESRVLVVHEAIASVVERFMQTGEGAVSVTFEIADAVPDGWARIEQQWVKLPDAVYASLVDDDHPGDDEALEV